MRLIDADAYRAAMKKRQDACVKWRNEARANGDAEDLIRAEQALSGFIEAKLTLDHTPTVDAVPVRRGWWNVYSAKNSLYTCSVCNHLPVSKTPYCPFCGARMENYRDV